MNSREIQKFHDLWAPMINSLPAVINAIDSGEELARALTQRRAEFDRLDAEFAAREGAHQAQVADIRARLNLVVEQAEADKAAALASVDEAKKEAAEAKKKHNEKAALAATVAAEAEKAAADALKKRDATLAEITVEGERRKVVIQAEIDELERKREAAEKALAELRFKLG
jgi:colicin import membrane protein